MIIRGSGSRKTNALLNLIKEQDDNDKMYLYAKDLSEPKDQSLIEKRENAGIKHLNDQKAFIECSNSMVMFMKILVSIIQQEKETF